jgi:hypothetical protein
MASEDKDECVTKDLVIREELALVFFGGGITISYESGAFDEGSCCNSQC